MISALFPPAFILIFGGLLSTVVNDRFRRALVLFLPLFAFYYIYQLPNGATLSTPFLNLDLTLLRVDALSKVFGYVFTLSAFGAFLYGSFVKNKTEFTSALLYIGSALGVVFAGDLFTLYLFWEAMAVTSVVLVLLRKTPESLSAGIRYVVVHIFGGLILLAGIILHLSYGEPITFQNFIYPSWGSLLILIGFLVNAAAFPFSSWLPDAYPESTIMGGVILSAYTSKTAVYALLRGFPGWDILIIVGSIMVIYGMIYAMLENDIRRLLAYCIVNQVGFMVIAVGVGSKLAIAGAAAHAFCHIIYKSLLWMAAGVIILRTGKSKLSELGGLHKTLPITFVLALIGALSTALPLTSSFTLKGIVVLAVEKAHLFQPWLLLEWGSVGVFAVIALKLIYFSFFGDQKVKATGEADKPMLAAMGMMAALCIILGVFPQIIYEILPYSKTVFKYMGHGFSDIYVHHFSHVVTKLQLISFTALAFFIGLPLIKNTNKQSLDVDWLYRKGWVIFYSTMSKTLNGLNSASHAFFVDTLTAGLINFAKNAPAKILTALLTPVWILSGQNTQQIKKNSAHLHDVIEANTMPIGVGALAALVFLGGLILL